MRNFILISSGFLLAAGVGVAAGQMSADEKPVAALKAEYQGPGLGGLSFSGECTPQGCKATLRSIAIPTAETKENFGPAPQIWDREMLYPLDSVKALLQSGCVLSGAQPKAFADENPSCNPAGEGEGEPAP